MGIENKELTLNEYQQKAMYTCIPSCDNFSYMMLNLVGEVGEIASKVAKAIRKGNAGIGLYDNNNELIYTEKLSLEQARELDKQIMLEIGDALWELAGLCHTMGWDLQEIAQMNLDKLAARKAAGTIDGNGDGILNR